MIKSDEKHMHIFHGGSLLVELTLEDGVVHKVYTSHSPDDVCTLISLMVSMVTHDASCCVHHGGSNNGIDVVQAIVSTTILV